MSVESLQAKMREIAKAIKPWKKVGVVTNHDADGLSAGAIAGKALQRAGKEIDFLVLKQIYRTEMPRIKALAEQLVITDFGSGQLDYLEEEIGAGDFVVLDHHQPLESDYALHANPWLHGIDGGSDVSAAGLAYLFAKALDEKNVDLASLAAVGACGDMQDNGNGKLVGLNAAIVEEGVAAGVLEKETDLRLYGRISRPLTQFLMYSTSPFLPELTGNEENCIRFLERNGIALKDAEKWRSYNDLHKAEKKRLTSALIVHLHRHGVPEWKIQLLVGEVYTRVEEAVDSPLRDAKEFATLMNACGRHGESEVALKVAMGDRGKAYDRAMGLLVQHRKELAEGIRLMQEEGLEERAGFYFFDARDRIKESIVGIVAGMMYSSGQINMGKPIIALCASEEGFLKASGRGTMELVRNGLNLGKTFREVCAELGPGNEGGGHPIAAGVKIRAENRDVFLEQVDARLRGLARENGY